MGDGYLSTLSCMDFPTAGKAGETSYPAGAMGVHLLNFGAVGTPLDPAKPQVLIYGVFSPTNPAVRCPASVNTHRM